MTKTYKVNTGKIISETLDGETIIINLETGCYYSMNPAGSQVWNAIIQGVSLDTSLPTINTFLEQLIEENLIIEAQGADSPSYQEGVAEGRGSSTASAPLTFFTPTQETDELLVLIDYLKTLEKDLENQQRLNHQVHIEKQLADIRNNIQTMLREVAQ